MNEPLSLARPLPRDPVGQAATGSLRVTGQPARTQIYAARAGFAQPVRRREQPARGRSPPASLGGRSPGGGADARAGGRLGRAGRAHSRARSRAEPCCGLTRCGAARLCGRGAPGAWAVWRGAARGSRGATQRCTACCCAGRGRRDAARHVPRTGAGRCRARALAGRGGR